MDKTPNTQPPVVVWVAQSTDLAGVREDDQIVALMELPEDQRAQAGVVIDVSGIELVTSRGMAELIMLRRELGSEKGRIRIAACCEQVERVIRVCHLDEFFGIDDTVDEARERLMEQ